MTDEIEKKYYTIGEVANILGESTSLLRFWEKEFEAFFKPGKTPGGSRSYHLSDIDTLKLIHYYVKTKGYTLKGAKEALRRDKKAGETTQLVNRLSAVKKFLTELQSHLETE
jgi:DNA-binding transcriptional MerR regulator